jgi:2,3-bisphosphoglycerate-dependent phosphoglycerate mutase
MKSLVSLLIILASVSFATAEPFVVIVRHAEKASEEGKDPDLSSEGLARAEALEQMVKDSGIVAIFTSEFKRTIETAAPTAKALGITPSVIPAKDTASLVANLRELKGNALVVNHSNSIPDLVKALGIDASIKIQENDYTELFIVTLGDKPKLLHLHYPDDLQWFKGSDARAPAK